MFPLRPALTTGSPALLGEYGRQRKAHNLSMMLGLDAIKSVFAGDAGLWSDVRNLGMGVLNSVPFVKVRPPPPVTTATTTTVTTTHVSATLTTVSRTHAVALTSPRARMVCVACARHDRRHRTRWPSLRWAWGLRPAGPQRRRVGTRARKLSDHSIPHHLAG